MKFALGIALALAIAAAGCAHKTAVKVPPAPVAASTASAPQKHHDGAIRLAWNHGPKQAATFLVAKPTKAVAIKVAYPAAKETAKEVTPPVVKQTAQYVALPAVKTVTFPARHPKKSAHAIKKSAQVAKKILW